MNKASDIDLSFFPLSSIPLPQIYNLIQASFTMHSSLAFPSKAWDKLKNDNVMLSEENGFLAFYGDAPVGIALWEVEPDYSSARMLLLAVIAQYQGKGVGNSILAEAIARIARLGINEIYAECYERFMRAHRLLDKHNFGIITIKAEEHISNYLGHNILYLHRVGKKLCRPKKRRRKGDI